MRPETAGFVERMVYHGADHERIAASPENFQKLFLECLDRMFVIISSEAPHPAISLQLHVLSNLMRGRASVAPFLVPLVADRRLACLFSIVFRIDVDAEPDLVLLVRQCRHVLHFLLAQPEFGASFGTYEELGVFHALGSAVVNCTDWSDMVATLAVLFQLPWHLSVACMADMRTLLMRELHSYATAAPTVMKMPDHIPDLWAMVSRRTPAMDVTLDIVATWDAALLSHRISKSQKIALLSGMECLLTPTVQADVLSADVAVAFVRMLYGVMDRRPVSLDIQSIALYLMREVAMRSSEALGLLLAIPGGGLFHLLAKAVHELNLNEPGADWLVYHALRFVSECCCGHDLGTKAVAAGLLVTLLSVVESNDKYWDVVFATFCAIAGDSRTIPFMFAMGVHLCVMRVLTSVCKCGDASPVHALSILELMTRPLCEERHDVLRVMSFFAVNGIPFMTVLARLCRESHLLARSLLSRLIPDHVARSEVLADVGSACMAALIPFLQPGLRCVICFGEEEDNTFVYLPCFHAFHTDCVQRWFLSKPECTCPQCAMSVPDNLSTFAPCSYSDA